MLTGIFPGAEPRSCQFQCRRTVEMDAITPTDRPGTRWPRSAKTACYVAVLIAAIALLVVMINISTGGSASQPPAEAAPPPPGNRADVQRWFRAREKPLIELNNALVPVVEKKIGSGGPTSAPCRRLSAAVLALKAQDRAPVAGIDELARAGLDKIEQAATACLAGDVAGAERLAAEGLAERADAQLPLEEVLEGE
jgi:hypothetical protein